MIRLTDTPAAEWLDLGHGVRVQVRPLETSLMLRAQEALRHDDAPAGDGAETIGRVSAKLAELAIIAWEGVGDDAGDPVDPSPERIRQLLAIWPIFESFQARYVAPRLILDAEGNVSAPLPNGTSAGAPSTADRAKGRARSARKP